MPHVDHIAELRAVLAQLDAHLTAEQVADIVAIGTYVRPMGGGLLPGDPIVRPLCAACKEATEP